MARPHPISVHPVQPLSTRTAANCSAAGARLVLLSLLLLALQSSPPSWTSSIARQHTQPESSLSYLKTVIMYVICADSMFCCHENMWEACWTRRFVNNFCNRFAGVKNGWQNAIEGCDPDNLCSPSNCIVAAAVQGQQSIILCLVFQLPKSVSPMVPVHNSI